MARTPARDPLAASALALTEALQGRFVQALERSTRALDPDAPPFSRVEWLRDDGRHGGGTRYETGDTPQLDRGSVNVSQVHYDDLPDKRLRSASALSTIIHPRHPLCPSVHIHISWTQLRSEAAYWRVMADLNPAIDIPEDTRAFTVALREAAGSWYDEGEAQGRRYFFIPALGRHRGATHFYLEGHDTGDHAADTALAQRVGEAAIDGYVEILETGWHRHGPPTTEQRAAQLAYHTLYFFQVLTLDRGTTSGLLVHDQNDVGILGSLPSAVDRALLASWRSKVPAPQDELLDALLEVLPEAGRDGRSEVSTEAKRQLASAIRQHYRRYPNALSLQASGNVTPPTVDNHR